MDVEEIPTHSYKEMLLDKQVLSQIEYHEGAPSPNINGDKKKCIDGSIALSKEYKKCLYHPWCFSVTIKVFGRGMTHHYLRSKLIDLWKPSKQLILIDLRWDFFVIKFGLEKNMAKAQHLGPWFISGNFLSK